MNYVLKDKLIRTIKGNTGNSMSKATGYEGACMHVERVVATLACGVEGTMAGGEK